MKAWLFVGARVVCVDGRESNSCYNHRPSRGVVEGETYTIRAVQDHGIIKGGLGVLLNEITSNIAPSGLEYSWAPERFRPVSTIDTTATVAQLARLTIPAGKVRV